MFNKIIKYIVYLLSFLIIIAFFALIYGIYIKIFPKTLNNYNIDEVVSLSLKQNQKIKEIQVMDDNIILIIIEDVDEIQGIIFNIDTQEIIQRLTK